MLNETKLTSKAHIILTICKPYEGSLLKSHNITFGRKIFHGELRLWSLSTNKLCYFIHFACWRSEKQRETSEKINCFNHPLGLGHGTCAIAIPENVHQMNIERIEIK